MDIQDGRDNEKHKIEIIRLYHVQKIRLACSSM